MTNLIRLNCEAFDDWANDRVVKKAGCIAQKGLRCYPSIRDRTCRDCFEQYEKEVKRRHKKTKE